MIRLLSEVEMPVFDFKITHHDKILTMGSCFSEEISLKLKKAGFEIEDNPFGVLYNPSSMAKGMRYILDNKKFEETDLFKYDGLYHSFDYHSRFSGTDASAVLNRIKLGMSRSSEFIKKCSILIFTFGTAYVYFLRKNNTVVANCHKLPSSEFVRRRLEVSGIVDEWSNIIRNIGAVNPGVKIIFTVSPVRHLKDGSIGNLRSKSVLLLAVERLVEKFHCSYFPSYEIFMDELRDYRFYADDLVHPSSFGIDYIWDKFSKTFFPEETLSLIKEWVKIGKAAGHRPFNPGTPEHERFVEETNNKFNEFLKKHPEFKK